MQQMTASQRADLAKRVATARLQRFGGKRRPAYEKAGLNATTWGRVEDGLSVKEPTIVAVVQMLWPEAGGDWRKLDPPLGSDGDTEPTTLEKAIAEIRESGVSESTKLYIIETLERDYAQRSKDKVMGRQPPQQ